jgi:hypothetical protein
MTKPRLRRKDSGNGDGSPFTPEQLVEIECKTAAFAAARERKGDDVPADLKILVYSFGRGIAPSWEAHLARTIGINRHRPANQAEITWSTFPNSVADIQRLTRKKSPR